MKEVSITSPKIDVPNPLKVSVEPAAPGSNTRLVTTVVGRGRRAPREGRGRWKRRGRRLDYTRRRAAGLLEKHPPGIMSRLARVFSSVFCCLPADLTRGPAGLDSYAEALAYTMQVIAAFAGSEERQRPSLAPAPTPARARINPAPGARDYLPLCLHGLRSPRLLLPSFRASLQPPPTSRETVIAFR